MARHVTHEHWVPSASRVAWNHFLTWKSYNQGYFFWLPEVWPEMSQATPGLHYPGSWVKIGNMSTINTKFFTPSQTRLPEGHHRVLASSSHRANPPQANLILKPCSKVPTCLHDFTFHQGVENRISKFSSGKKNTHEFKNISECLQCGRHKRYCFEQHKCRSWGITF